MQKGEYVYIILNKIDERDFGGIYSVQSITEKIYSMKQIFFRDDRMLFFHMNVIGRKSMPLLPNFKDLKVHCTKREWQTRLSVICLT